MQHTVGFAVAKPAEVLGAEPYMHELVTGIERVLLSRGGSLLLRVVPSRDEVASTIRRWAQTGSVDAVVLIDLEPNDPIVDTVTELGLAAVVSGDPTTARGLSAVWAQDDRVMASAVRAIADLGHLSIAHISGPVSMAHTQLRMRTFETITAELGIDSGQFEGDYSQRSGYEAGLALLSTSTPPTAIIADNDLMAIGALEAAVASGVEVPRDLSILAWDDSALCQLSVPTLSAMSHDVQSIGESVGAAALDGIEGGGAVTVMAPPAEFIARGSTDEANR